MMIGIVGEAGETKCVACLAQATDTTAVERTIKTEFFGVYGQAQGEFGNGMTLEVQAQYATAGGDPSANKLRLFTKSDGFSAAAMLGINPMVGVKVAYLSYTDKSGTSDVDTQSTVLGLWLNLAQNISIVPEYSFYSGDGRSDDSKYLIMLFFGA